MIRLEKCPRCDAKLGEKDFHCSGCGLHIRYEETAQPFKEGPPPVSRRERGLPKFHLKEDEWMPQEVPLPKAGPKAWLSLLLAGGLLYFSHPLLRKYNSFFGNFNGEVSVQVLPPSEQPSSHLPSRQPAQEDKKQTPLRRSPPEEAIDMIVPALDLSGRVYGLLTMRPVGGAELLFEDVASRQNVKTVSNADGFFSVRIPRAMGGDLELRISCPGYDQRSIVKDPTESRYIRGLSLAKRKKRGQKSLQGMQAGEPLRSENYPLGMDVFLIPNEIK